MVVLYSIFMSIVMYKAIRHACMHQIRFYPPISYICFNNHRGECPLQYPQQETSQIQDSMTVVFPWRDWECSLKDNRYFPAVVSIQETGQNKPDELVV